ncbi:MAG: hypothetical protein IJW31_06340 [Lentisphaeria bacterium]|nr:hypothetical protein [Lentisphaeria bacterium]
MNIKNPENKYRPTPFWSWNDKLDPEELRYQVREMHAAGQGGFFMHARGGLQTKYMSKEWMDCINASIDEASKYGMEAYLYDENGWPSGFGDGLVNGLGEAYQLKYLRFEKKPLSECGSERTIAYYESDGTFISREKPENYQGEVLRFYYEVNQFYVDNLDAKVVKEFLDRIYEHYYKNIPAEILKHLRGVFTDEPQLSRDGIAWSFVLEEEYFKFCGQELIYDLPKLYFNMAESKKVRVRFWKLVARLFSENFCKQIYDWCSEHNWLLTGHGLIEELGKTHITSNGDIMPIYRYFHIPGVDHLCRKEPSKTAAIQLLSAAHQTGKKQLMSESFALCGWNFNFSGMHWLFNQQLSLGINFLCPHLSSYRLRGLRKRDYPASLFIHQPWWGDYKKVNDYFSRAGMLLAEGREKVDLLVLHPISTLHLIYKCDNENDLKYYIEKYQELSESLSRRHITYHYGDEIYFDDYGTVDGDTIVIGECRYNYVLIPQLTNLSAKVVEILRQFEKNGGKIVKIKNNSEYSDLTIDGDEATAEVRDWFDNIEEVADENQAAEVVANNLPKIVKSTENGKVTDSLLSIRRYFDDIGDGRSGVFYLITNSRYTAKCDAVISLAQDGKYVELIDRESGEFARISNVETVDNRLTFNYNFGAGEAIMLFVTDSMNPSGKAIETINVDKLQCQKKLSDEMTLKSLGLGNVMTLDRCRYRVNGGEWIDDEINVIHPRLIKKGENCDLEMEIDFVIEDDFDLSNKLTFISETPEIFSYSLNGVAFEAKDSGYLFDKSFRKIELPNILRHGVNTITAKCHYFQSEETHANYRKAMIFESEYNKLCYDTEIENFYLLGDFKVKYQGDCETLERNAERLNGKFSIGRSQVGEKLPISDIVLNGMPFFSGKVVFASEFTLSAEELDKINYLRFKGIGANSYRVWINGEEAGFVYMENYYLALKKYLKVGVNTIEIELTTSLRNTLGPHHLEEGESYAVHTLSFSREACSSAWNPPPYNPDYAFVKVGLSDIELV